MKNPESKKDKPVVAAKPMRANVLTKMWYIFVKDFKLLVRSKVSALVFFLGPLIITLMVCMAFNTSSLYSVRIAAYSDAYSPMSEAILANLSNSEYAIVKVNSLNECTDSVKANDFQICAVFAPNMVASNSASNSIELFVDNSRVNIANQLVDSVNTRVNVQSSEVSSAIVRQILEVLDSINKEVAQREVTVKKLSETNVDSQAKLGTALGGLGSVDFNPSAYNVSGINSAIAAIANQNVSTSSLNASIASLIGAYSSTVDKLNNAKSKTSELSRGVSDVVNSLAADKARLDSLSSSITTISAGIATVKITNVESIVRPIRMSIEPLSQTKNYLAYIFPSLLAMIVMFMSVLMTTSAVIQERKSNAYFRNFISPTSDFLLLFGRYLTLLVVVAAEIALVLLLGSFFLKSMSFGALSLVGGILLLEATVFIFLGMFIGYLFETSESATIAAISVSTVSLFLSNVVLPIEIMSGTLRRVVDFNPFVITESIIKKILLFNTNFTTFFNLFLTLGVFAGVFFVLTIVSWFVNKRLSA